MGLLSNPLVMVQMNLQALRPGDDPRQPSEGLEASGCIRRCVFAPDAQCRKQSRGMSFSGSTNRRRIALGGKARTEESREQLLKRAHQEREQRRQQKLEQQSALHIQTCWRRRREAVSARAAVNRRWQQAYGAIESTSIESQATLDSSFFRELCFFAREFDSLPLSAGCRLLLNNQNADGVLQLSGSASTVQDVALLVFRAKRLSAECLSLLSQHWTMLQHQQGFEPEMVVTALLAMSDPASWASSSRLMPAEHAAAAVISHLACKRSMFRQLAWIVHSCLPTEASHTGIAPQTRDLAQRLVTGLTARALSLGAQAAPILERLPQLLTVPLLWARCTSLRPLGAQVWQQAVPAMLAAGSRSAIVAQLRAGACVGGAGGACTCLLGNLAEASAAGLQAEQGKAQAEAEAGARGQLAWHFVQVALELLQLSPLQAAFSAATPMDTGEAEDDQDAGASQPALPQEHLPWEGLAAVPDGLASQLLALGEATLLRPLVQQLLPVRSMVSVSNGRLPRGPSVELAGRVRDLCALLSRMLQTEPLRPHVLVALAASAELVPRLWFSYLKSAHEANVWLASQDATADPGWMLPLVVLSPIFSTSLATAGDEALYQHQRPLSLEELYSSSGSHGLLGLLKSALWQNLWADSGTGAAKLGPAAEALRANLRRSVGTLLGQLYDRNTRHSFAPVEAFQAEGLPKGQSAAAASAQAAGWLTDAGTTHGRIGAVLRHAPFMMPFEERARIFQSFMALQRAEHNASTRSHHPFGIEPVSFVTVRRDHLLEDGYEGLHRMRDELKGRVRIAFVDEYGTHEAGVDGGGLFKDFLEGLVREGFDPQLGLFKATSDNRLYPNPDAHLLVPNALAYFEFLGRMMAKALYEGILVELPLAGFFLKKLLRRGCDVNDLPTLDPELYRHLMMLREMSGPEQVDALALTFTISSSELDKHREVELVPGGRDRAVTAANRIEYIHRVANFRLNVQIRAAAEAFRAGLELVVSRNWTTMFNEGELQMLISGGEGEGLNLTDLQAHVHYAGGYHEEHPVIHDLWDALADFTPKQQALWLRFVTACSRAPLLGFAYLEPKLCVQMAGGVLDGSTQQRLPTSTTCVNLLKLPPYQAPGVLRSKMLLAIRNAAGFDLS